MVGNPRVWEHSWKRLGDHNVFLCVFFSEFFDLSPSTVTVCQTSAHCVRRSYARTSQHDVELYVVSDHVSVSVVLHCKQQLENNDFAAGGQLFMCGRKV